MSRIEHTSATFYIRRQFWYNHAQDDENMHLMRHKTDTLAINREEHQQYQKRICEKRISDFKQSRTEQPKPPYCQY